MCVHLLHAPPKFDCSALDQCPGLSLPKVLHSTSVRLLQAEQITVGRINVTGYPFCSALYRK